MKRGQCFGLGALLAQLGGENLSQDEDIQAFLSGVGKTITDLTIRDNNLLITLEDTLHLRIFDDGQNCCETRYMTSDDELPYFIGSILLDAEIKDAPQEERDDGDDIHQIQFLEVKTSKGSFTIATHNEHNGWYGGIFIKIKQA